MRKIHLVLRLFFEAKLSIRAIARSIGASPATVGDYIRRARVAGLITWPLPEELDERALEARLVQRWLDHGKSPEDARRRALDFDIPNARRIERDSLPADMDVPN